MSDADIMNGRPLTDEHIPAPLAHRPPAELFVTDDGVRLVEDTDESIGAWIEAEEFVRLEAKR